MSYVPNYVTTPVGINAELTKIATAISQCLQGSGTTLLQDLDLNNHQILNLRSAVHNTDPVRLMDLHSYVDTVLIPELERDYGLGNSYDPSIWNAKQDTLVSGVNIKTINGASVLGSGNLVISGGGGGPGGHTDHNDLLVRDAADAHPVSSITGLTEALAGKASTSHTHSTADITGLDTALAGKAAASHSHAISDVVNLQSSLDSKASSSHVHTIANVTGLQSALDSKASVSHTHSISEVTGLQTALDGKASTAVATTSVNGLMSSTDKTKLNGVATGATANATDASLRDRTTHTGSQAISTVTGLQTALDGKQAASANIRNIHIGTTAPADTSFLWLDTN